MMGIVPTFGIDGYTARVVAAVDDAPASMPLVEGALLAGLGGAAALLLVVAMFRRSAVAAVSFSFLALIGLVCAICFGRLDFVAQPTQIFILCLAACAWLLFITATLKVARDNPLMGIIVLVAIAVLLVVGAGTALGKIDGAPLMRLGIAGTFGLTIFSLIVELVRKDKPSLIVAPGLLAMMAAPALMAWVTPNAVASWQLVALPLMVLAAGALYSAVAAQFVITVGKSGAVDAMTGSAAGLTPAPSIMMREVAPDPQPMAPVRRSADPIIDVEPSHDAFDRGPIRAFDEEPAVAPARTPHNYAAVPTPRRSVASMPPSPRFDDTAPVAEPVSARWGAAPAAAAQPRGPVVADDEYVWDQLAAQEVKMGPRFASMLNVPAGVVASPDVLREVIAAGSLDDFDDQLLGGIQPATGRFQVELTTLDRASVQIEGRRQVDQDGILMRIEARATPLAPARMAAPTAPALTALRSDRAAPKSSQKQGDVAGAIARGEIEAHFQPIVRLSDGVTVGFEALARWRHRDGTLVEAKDFVGDLIKAGQGIALAEFVIGQSARELATWIAAEPGQGQFVAINIAASDLPKGDLTKVVEDAVKTHALPAGALVVELTEGRIQASQANALAAAKAVRQAGASLAIDDFGVGFSTLSRLAKFKFDLIKTDRSLISDLSNKRAYSFMKTLLSMAKKQGTPVIAEGVESEETADILRELGCEFAQGYLFGGPEPVGGHATGAGGHTPEDERTAGLR